MYSRIRAVVLLAGAIVAVALLAQEPKKDMPKAEPAPGRAPAADQLAFFEKKIRPVLVGKCVECHSGEKNKLKGGLALDSTAGLLKGGDSGPTVVPGQPAESLLIKAIQHADPDLKMPPKKKLAHGIIADFETWVKMGAPAPKDADPKAAWTGVDIEQGREFWAFQPVKKPAVPTVKNITWARTDVDRFLPAALETRGLNPVTDADKYTLLRRVYFDLIGLPPTPDEMAAFERDSSDTAFETVADKLLASERFGERWGRYWLDVARYTESSGKEVDLAYPQAWRYRDYVIAAFNADKPFDQFVGEQLAGDLLPATDPRRQAELQIATAFLALGPKSHIERKKLPFELDVVDGRIEVTTTAFLGLTVACARCHDHKFDPIPQTDYYALASIFRSAPYAQGGDGRDHNYLGYTTSFAGGGAKAGFAHGSTDDFGLKSVTNPVHIHDWPATILHRLGLDHEKLTFRYAGGDMRLIEVKGNVVKDILA
jgi:hypothetical protein